MKTPNLGVHKTSSRPDTEDLVIAHIKTMLRGMIEKIAVTPKEGQAPQLTIHGNGPFTGVMQAAGLPEGYEKQEPKRQHPRLLSRRRVCCQWLRGQDLNL